MIGFHGEEGGEVSRVSRHDDKSKRAPRENEDSTTRGFWMLIHAHLYADEREIPNAFQEREILFFVIFLFFFFFSVVRLLLILI